ncbi:WD40-repeat-containing domain protein [Fomitopsis serialis]|uniref:WD40-repeat-containing domain protein n=1 Tax=Fomitopsis serialis TaxID=139415 RepID=UPI0020076415|nr:WD40-repeat-containing domain protein [Neoantrodia serialis]KAH9938390.1 WD40-repeat-containing domain protein [Neoantrodia serialis]
MQHSMMFASGGYDHVVHLWDASRDVSRPSPTPLAIKHTSTVQSLLAIRDTSHKLVSSGADCNVHIYDLSSERVVNTLKTSNSVYHAHEALSPFCTLLEVAHRELQFEIRDHRLVPQEAVQRFGYPSRQVHGRYIKGDVRCGKFACGDKDGMVRLWDLRNTQQTIEMIPCFTDQRITQVVFDDARLVACSEDHELAYCHHRSGA